jgi:response regulator RpfG family c-di-GMP phosphodiesterase
MAMEQGRTVTERRPRVLLVEDDATTRELVARQLDKQGCVVSAVDAAEEGIVEAGEVKFDAVVADVHLPGLSGLDLAGFLLSQDPELPVILMTGDRDEELAREALARGPVSFLIKPFEAAEIEVALRQALSKRGWTPVDGAGYTDAAVPLVPHEWLDIVDKDSFAGPGHGDRVARIAATLLAAMPVASEAVDPADLALAARTHEVGRLRSPSADTVTVATQSAELMAEARFPRPAVRAVRHMHERFDGSGGPDRLSATDIPLAAQILAVADATDHYTSAWVQAGLNPDNALDRAIHLVSVQQGETFSPVVVAALQRKREITREICTAPRLDAGPRQVTTASFASDLAAIPFKVA